MIEIKIAVCDIPELFASFTKKEKAQSDLLDKAEVQCELLDKALERSVEQCCALKGQINNLEKEYNTFTSRFLAVTHECDGFKAAHKTLTSQFSYCAQERDDLKARLSRYEAIPGFQAPSEPMPMHMMTRSEAVENIGKMLIHLRDGEKILAIKIVRQLTGCGLKEAKDACDNYYLPR